MKLPLRGLGYGGAALASERQQNGTQAVPAKYLVLGTELLIGKLRNGFYLALGFLSSSPIA